MKVKLANIVVAGIRQKKQTKLFNSSARLMLNLVPKRIDLVLYSLGQILNLLSTN